MRTAWLITLLIPVMLVAQDLASERKLYAVAHKDQQASAELLSLTANADTTAPVQKAYRGAALMVAAQFAKGAGKKVGLFKEGKNLMTRAIQAAPESVEIHFLRMTVQENAPKILGYKDSIQQDKDHILGHFQALKDKGLMRMIQDHASTSAIYSEAEKAKLQPDR